VNKHKAASTAGFVPRNIVLPLEWQSFVIVMANICHHSGKTVPIQWQSFAIMMTNVWQKQV